jgi:hypothetical protein
MAKKSKKSSKKKSKAMSKARGGGRGGSRRPAAKKAARSTAPKAVKTGRGSSALEIGRDLVERYNRGEFASIEDRWWSPRITSVEGYGVEMAWEGRRAVEAKNRGWVEAHTVHGTRAEGPYVGASGFAVKFFIDVEEKATGQRTRMEEVGVYQVQNGKIVREEFMYSVGPAEERAGAAEEAGVIGVGVGEM